MTDLQKQKAMLTTMYDVDLASAIEFWENCPLERRVMAVSTAQAIIDLNGKSLSKGISAEDDAPGGVAPMYIIARMAILGFASTGIGCMRKMEMEDG